MKKFLILLLLFPLLASAQLDFESNKNKLNFVSLPAIESLMSIPLSFDADFSNEYSNKLPSFKMDKNNYREPVSMYEAMAATENYVNTDIQISLDPKEYGVFGGNSSYTADGATKVKNIVYKDASRGFLYADSCPPFGICPRCAPYRLGRR